jgi:hypothetical protein
MSGLPVLLTPAQAAQQLGFKSREVIYSLCRRGLLPHTYLFGPLRIPSKALVELIEQTTECKQSTNTVGAILELRAATGAEIEQIARHKKGLK